MEQKLKAISLFSGAGGMDVGFKNAGIDIIFANELDKYACQTYKANHPKSLLIEGNINQHLSFFEKQKNKIDIVFGGPPCQGFSVAGKMDPNDERSKLVWSFLNVVKLVRPKAFIIENVKALGISPRWHETREKIIQIAKEMGYTISFHILNSVDFGVPQKRERVFFIGFLNSYIDVSKLEINFEKFHQPKVDLRTALKKLGPVGTEINPNTCTAKITFAKNPVLRKSPYAGMLFNGMGRPLNLDDAANTLPASMGGNKTPIVDEEYLNYGAQQNWIIKFHQEIMNKNIDLSKAIVPDRLRRLSIKEAATIQTFPEDYTFVGTKSTIYKQIGNAVPCKLAEVVAKVVSNNLLNNSLTFTLPNNENVYFEDNNSKITQLTIDDFL